MDLGMTGYQIVGGFASRYAGDTPEDAKVQVEETSNTLLYEFVCPVHCEVIAFGVAIVEDFDAHGTDPVVSLKKATTVGGTETVLKALTIGGTTLTRGNGEFGEDVTHTVKTIESVPLILNENVDLEVSGAHCAEPVL